MEFIKIRSYKRKIIWAIAFCLCIVLYRNIGQRKLYMVYLNDEPIAVTATKPETVLDTYGDVKAMRYSQGAQEINDEISISELNEKVNMEVLNEDELSETLYLSLNDEEPVLTGKSMQTFTHTEKYYAPCQYIYDDDMYNDEEEIIQEGKEGSMQVTVLATYFDGEELERKPFDTEITETAIPKVVHIGTKDRPEYILPVISYTFTSGFGPRWGTNHNGVDLAVPVGTEVYAAADGVVVQSGWNGGYGICIDIDHGNGVVTRYGHMSQSDVAVGQNIEQGQHIGLSGNTGNSTGPHVHFEIRIEDEAVNPMDYIN